MLRLWLLGGCRVAGDDGSAVRQLSVRQQQLIAFLVLHGRTASIPRQRIAGSLWPESSDTQALTNLRRELHHLRDAWPQLDALIDAGSRTLTWRGAAGAIVDVVAFEEAADRGLAGDRAALQQAARLYKGDILPDCAGEWIDADRERLRQRATKVLTRLVELLERDRAFSDAIEHAQQLLRVDPLDEQVWCALMRCHARRGERATALHLYQQCAALLKKELGIQPSAATRTTYREILDLDAEAPVPPAPPRTAVYPLVGRNAEWHALLNAWRAAAAGRPRLFLIRGEAGIGKSRLAEELIAWCGPQGVNTVTARCYAGEGRLAYAPIAGWLKSEALQPMLMRLDAPWLTHVARLRPELVTARPEIPVLDRELENWQRLQFFEALAQAFQSADPLVLVLDDLQWADADTIEWLQYFLRSASTTRYLVVGTVRPRKRRTIRRSAGCSAVSNTTIYSPRSHSARSIGPQPRYWRAKSPSSLWTTRRWRARSSRPKDILSSSSNADAWSWGGRRAHLAIKICRECSLSWRPGWRCSQRRREPPLKSRRRWDVISGSTSWRNPATSRRTRWSARSTSSGAATSSAFKRTNDGTSATIASARLRTVESVRPAGA